MNDKKKEDRDETFFPKSRMVNVMQFITVKGKSYIIHVMFYYNDLGRAVDHKIIQKHEKVPHLRTAMLYVVRLTTSSKWVWSCEQRE